MFLEYALVQFVDDANRGYKIETAAVCRPKSEILGIDDDIPRSPKFCKKHVWVAK